jgi:aspartyl aminopeptidase
VPDLAAHLSKKVQGDKKLEEAVEAESLDVICGNIPIKDEKIKKKFKSFVLRELNKKYGIKEADLTSAELELVPAYGARTVGFDESMVGGYGQDDRACAFTAFKAILDMRAPTYTSVALFVDKEEIGSTGLTGIKGRFLELLAMRLAGDKYVEALANSKAISADTTSCLNPNYKKVFDAKNAHLIGHGVAVDKYTGYKGKYMASEASA